MTAVVGLVQNGYVTLGADSRGMNVDTYDMGSRADPKVFVGGAMIFGYTSSFRMGQLLEHTGRWAEPMFATTPGNSMAFMVTTFVDEVRRIFKEGGWESKEDGREVGGDFIVARGSELFSIGSDFQVVRTTDPYTAIGCGEHYALGALHALRRNRRLNPNERVKAALEAAGHHNAGVGPPYVALNTQDLKVVTL